jgi:sigma-E factor negative regulatory protein RseA
MTHEISSLMDGELQAHEAERAIRACCADSEAAQKWQEYHLISDVLRGGRPHPSGTAERVRKALESEPAIVARPKRILDTTFGRVALATAASVATIGVVGWIGSQGGPAVSGGVVAKNPTAVQPVALKPAPAATESPDVQDYLAAHRQLPSVELYRTVTNRAPAAPAAAAR